MRQFFAAIRDGDMNGLEIVLAEDVIFYADGGGKAPAVREPVRGKAAVGRFILGLARQVTKSGCQVDHMRVNGQPAIRVATPTGALLGVASLDIRDGQIAAVYNQINPDKLSHLGPTATLDAQVAGDS